MTLLDRYLTRTVIGYSFMVMAMLLTLGGLFLFVGEQEDIGDGNYHSADALMYTLLHLPEQFFELMPVGVLLGALLGLGALARGSELIVMRASGISIARIGGSVALAGVVLAVLAGLVGEYVAPPLQKFARQQKVFARSGQIHYAGGGAWVKDGNAMINVQEQAGAGLFGGVYIFRFRTPQELDSIARAERATPTAEGRWQLERYTVTRFGEERVDAQRAALTGLELNVDADFFGLAAGSPRQLPSRSLWRLIGHLKSNDLDTTSYEFAFWSRLARTCAIVVVALLATPFVFGPLRSSGSGARLLVGVLIGVGFFLLQRTLESGTIVFDLDPMLLAWMPTLLLAALTLALIARTR